MEKEFEGERSVPEGPGEATAGERGPVGTLFFLMIYVMVLAGMWGTMYWILLSR